MNEEPFRIHQIERVVYDASGRRFDPATHAWTPSPHAPRGRAADVLAAATWLQRDSGHPRRLPVAVVGGATPTPTEIATAWQLGRALARMGLTVLVLGAGGIADAVCRGATDVDGQAISLVASEADANTNAHATIALPVGTLGPGLLAGAVLAVIALGNDIDGLPGLAAARAAGGTIIPLAPEKPDDVRGGPIEPILERVAQRVLGL